MNKIGRAHVIGSRESESSRWTLYVDEAIPNPIQQAKNVCGVGSAHNSLHNLSVCLVLSGMCSSFSQTVQAYSIARFEKHVFLLHATRGSISLECFSYIP